MKPEELKKELTEIYSLLSALSVNGDAVDVIAAIRAKLRKLVKEAETEASNG